MSKQPKPNLYLPLGKKLKQLRSQANETLAEASGAVEIDVRQLAEYELGQDRPSEDVLLLLISHFGVRDDEAVNLWELAGYGMTKISTAHMASNQRFAESENQEAPILFTDIVDVVVNNYGVVMNFLQGSGPSNKPKPVARVGMSRDHAKSLLQILEVTLNQTESLLPKTSKRLIAPDNPQANDKK